MRIRISWAAGILACAGWLCAHAVLGAQGIQWLHQFGGSGQDTAYSVAAGAGRAALAGYASQALPGQTYAGGVLDAYVRVYDADGNLLWTRQFGTSDDDRASAAAIDSGGNVYVGGTTTGSLASAPIGAEDAFLRKYDPSGNVLWTRQFGTSSFDHAYSLAVDGAGNVYSAGQTNGTFTGEVSAGSTDVFVRKYDTLGNALWTRQFGTSQPEDPGRIAVDAAGNLIVPGRTYGVLPGQVSSGSGDVFVRKYDTLGNLVWTQQFGTAADDFGAVVGTDDDLNVIVQGTTFGAFPGNAAAGSWDIFVRKLDAAGTPAWTRQFGTAGEDSARLAVSPAGSSYVAGAVPSALPGQTWAGRSDGFVREYDAAGTERWTHQFGSAADDAVSGVAFDPEGGLFVSIGTRGALAGQTYAGGEDAAIARIDLPPAADVTPPVLTLPANITAPATAPNGAVVVFSATALDDVDGAVAVICEPASGSTFPIGTTTVTCRASDAAENPSTGTFHVTVLSPPACPAVPAGLTGWWNADAVQGSTAFDSAGTSNGVLSGSVQIGPGRVGSAFVMTGTAGTRVAGTLSPAGYAGIDAPVTVAAWFNQTAAVGHPGKGVIGIGGTGLRQHLFVRLCSACLPDGGIFVGPNGGPPDGQNRIWVGVDSGPLDRWWGSNAVIQPGSWYFVAVSYDPAGRQMTIYVNGHHDRTVTLATGLLLTRSFYIGADGHNDSWFSGSIDEAQVYSRVLGASDVLGLYQSATPGFCTDTTPPLFSLPANPATEATSEAGAVVSYTAKAYDNVDGPVAVSCSPESGSTFPVGTTTVVCSATDTAGNDATDSFDVTVTPLPVCIAAPAGLQGWWTADAVAGSTALDAAHDNDATMSGQVQIGPGKVGSAFVLNGTAGTRLSGVLDVASYAGGDAPVTMAAWFKQTAASGHPGKGIIGLGGTGQREHLFVRLCSTCLTHNGIFDNPNGGGPDGQNRIWVGADSGDLDRWWGTSAVVEPGTWNFVAVTYEPSSRALKIYVNGQLDRTVTLASGLALTRSFYIGADAHNDSWFNGAIDEPQIYNRALTAAEVGALYGASWAGVCGDVTPPDIELSTIEPNRTIAATGPDGAFALYVATAHDDVDGAVSVGCDPPAGSLLPIGPTTITCTAVDAAGNEGSESFVLTVVDTTGPVFSLPEIAPIEATSAQGAPAEWLVFADDLVDGDVPVTCSATSGETFAIGTTEVTCTAADSRGNESSASFSIAVVDTTGPAIVVPDVPNVEATSAGGAAVDYVVTATDIVDGSVAVTCSAASGAVFPIGQVQIDCVAEDSRQNTSTASFTFEVLDTTGPSIAVPSIPPVEATSPAGATVVYVATASDLVDAAVDVNCSPASGSTFPVGTTAVACSAIDMRGNPSQASFTIVVVDTLAPSLSLEDPREGIDAVFTSTVGGMYRIDYRAGDIVGVASVTINGLPTVLSSGTSQDGMWSRSVPVAVGGLNTFMVSAWDAAGNVVSSGFVADGDGIAAVLDRNGDTGEDESNLFSNTYRKDAHTFGSIVDRAGWAAVFVENFGRKPMAEVLVAYARRSYDGPIQGPGGIAKISACSGRYKEIRLDKEGEMASWRCDASGTLHIRAENPMPSIEVFKQLCDGCGLQAIASLTIGQALSTGSPFTADPSNTEPIVVQILDENEQPVGSFSLDPGESVDMEASVRPDGIDQVVATVLNGTVTISLWDQTHTSSAGSGPLTIVHDTMPPVIANASVDKPVLGPPNHKMIGVALSYAVTDDVDASPACSVSVSSNEPLNGTGDGDTAPDWRVVSPRHVQLRAERAGTGAGRIYTLTLTCADTAGNSSSRQLFVTVPKGR